MKYQLRSVQKDSVPAAVAAASSSIDIRLSYRIKQRVKVVESTAPTASVVIGPPPPASSQNGR
jgi:hypothetical protein